MQRMRPCDCRGVTALDARDQALLSAVLATTNKKVPVHALGRMGTVCDLAVWARFIFYQSAGVGAHWRAEFIQHKNKWHNT